MTQALLSIMVPCLSRRPWRRTVERIIQLAGEYVSGAVEVLYDVDDGQVTSGVKRQRLIERARGDYVAFVDDDDWQTDDYVTRLLEGCHRGVDVVCFRLRLVRPDRRHPEHWTYSLSNWPQDRRAGKMTANHLCAWRRDLAMRVAWCPDLGYADDQLWYQPLVASGLARTSWDVDKVLYEYRYSPSGTSQQSREQVQRSRDYVGEGLRCFTCADGRIVIETPNRDVLRTDRNELVHKSRFGELREFHTVRIN